MSFFSSISPASNPGPYHVLTYGTLLGTSIWHSFMGGIVSFRVLPRPQFATLQSHLFPLYFTLQTLLPLALALTYPPSSAASSPLQTHPSIHRTTAGSLAGVLAAENRWSILVPLVAMVVCGAANMLVVGPATTKTMRERKHQETRDGKKSYDAGPHSPAMAALNKQFGMLHGASSILNLGAIFAMLAYGITLGGRIA